MQVVVIGGTGHLGSRVLEGTKAAGIPVESASRRGALRVDLTDPNSFGALSKADVIVDLADSTTFAPDALAAWCVENGKVFLEASSDVRTIDRLRERFREAKGPGAVVLGAGIYTGMSNLLAADAAKKTGKCSALTLAIRSSPLSGAGAGTVALMVGLLSVAATSLSQGNKRTHAPAEPGPRAKFPSGEGNTLRIPLAESVMLPHSTGASTVDVVFAPGGRFMTWAFGAMPTFLWNSSLFKSFLGAYLGFLRTVLLKGKPSPVEFYVRAEGSDGVVERTLLTNDGMLAGGFAIGGILKALEPRHKELRGLLMIDQAIELSSALEAANKIAPDAAKLHVDAR